MGFTRRKFTTEFKEMAMRRLDVASMAEVARISGVSPSVLHRWRRELRDYRGKASAERRKFTKDAKQAAVRRLELGASVAEVAGEYAVNPTTLRRWRKELRNYGAAAFSGYGKSRAETDPRTEAVVLRLTQDEYGRVEAASSTGGASSVPDFIRSTILKTRDEPSLAELSAKLDSLRTVLQRLAQMVVSRGQIR